MEEVCEVGLSAQTGARGCLHSPSHCPGYPVLAANLQTHDATGQPQQPQTEQHVELHRPDTSV